jgi:3-deoxy-manno-octulosonate cytidylyltransferase (CMP-KDO synthetase)
MTSTECLNGTERVAEVATKIKADYYVNIQGDEPCIKIDAINTFVASLQKFEQVNFIQAVSKIAETELTSSESIVKVAITKNNEILYYSRLPIPYSREKNKIKEVHYKSLGLYLYSRDFLFKYSLMGSSKLENTEHIEQLRILENGISIHAVEVNDDGISVDTEEDLVKIRNKYRDCFKD